MEGGNAPHSGSQANSSGSGSHPAAGGGGHGGGHSDPAMAAAFALRLQNNQNAATYYAASICGIIAIFIFLHWTRQLVNRSSRLPAIICRPFVVVSRRLRNVLVRGAPGVSSTGHGLLVGLYVAINVSLLFTNVDKSVAGPLASRFGWILASNICFVVFLALKNTPLAYLTSYSYERLNCLHQIAGCTTFLLMVMHSATYTAFFYQRGKLEVLRESNQIAGIIAGFMFLVMAGSAMLLRRFAYEVFYVMHMTAFVVSIICIGFHRPEIRTKLPVVVCLTAALFIADRLLRWSRLLLNCTNNEATVYPLANGGTRIILTKRPHRSVPGKHVFLWIPRIRAFEMHPFTIIDTGASGSAEFVVKSYNGFTRKLHTYASANPGAKMWAAAEGPYGTFPDPMEYDKIILIAGGSGASYTFGLAVNMLERMDAQSAKNIVFIWTAKTEENLTWFAEHLNTLRTHQNAPRVHVSLYVTRVPGSSSSDEATRNSNNLGGAITGAQPPGAGLTGAAPVSGLHHDNDSEKLAVEEKEHAVEKETAAVIENRGTFETSKAVVADLEKATAAADVDAEAGAGARAASDTSVSESLPLRHSFSPGRPDAETVIRNAVSSAAPSQRVLVAACGPPSLMTTVRDVTAKCITSDGPSVELHCEQFGW